MEKTAAQKVFGTTEPSEAIILHLPIHDLLFAKNVCADWRDIVLESPTVREHLLEWTEDHETTLGTWTLSPGAYLIDCNLILALRDDGEITILIGPWAKPLLPLHRQCKGNTCLDLKCRWYWEDGDGYTIVEDSRPTMVPYYLRRHLTTTCSYRSDRQSLIRDGKYDKKVAERARKRRQEKERRRYYGLCFYCGSGDHTIRECTKRPQREYD